MPQIPEFAFAYPLLMNSAIKETEFQVLDEKDQMFAGNLQV